ncbi:MAG: Leucyl/phenylalanyl-tRNA--protein transferase [Thermodesulfobacteriota bacterium]|jgi:leucyl/phenylalanyl-tRNA--protein transferase|nr:Leucyl/phenylalanyl-tRNA--protein transferase [Thermodesulfobacteriota bacterium]
MKSFSMSSMPIFRLTEEIVFPPPRLASEGGLLAVGGDLAPERLILAYRNGIFPWYNEGEPILWWSPDPRFVLFPDRLKISRSMRGLLKKNLFTVTFDTSFREVIAACQETRRGRGEGTWITAAMTAAYIRLHELGLAHSVEAWREKTLVGGLYGVSLGKCFFGESMFTQVPNASKAALITLVETLGRYDFRLIDCQVYTDHLRRLGAEMMSREDFLQVLREALAYETLRGNWRFLNNKSLSS